MEMPECLKQVDRLLGHPRQMWLLGAGISRDSGVPTMHSLTKRIEQLLKGKNRRDYRVILGQISDGAHVEHVLSHVGDLIEIVRRSRSGWVSVGRAKRSMSELNDLHARIREGIRDTIQCGYAPPTGSEPERIGTPTSPIVSIERHVAFIRAVYSRRTGLDVRPPVAFFTINYDTLLEDALALCRISATDGFSGGAMAFWDPLRPGLCFCSPFEWEGNLQAKVYKMHGSVDWFRCEPDIVVRRRAGVTYPGDDPSKLIIYPQTAKYRAIQEEPFASLFSIFRNALESPEEALLAVCGYSFGDDHINSLIERALRLRTNKLTVLVFTFQHDLADGLEGLPPALARWLTTGSDQWKERIVVVGNKGIYHGNLQNLYPCQQGEHPWWSFAGVTRLLLNGPEVVA